MTKLQPFVVHSFVGALNGRQFFTPTRTARIYLWRWNLAAINMEDRIRELTERVRVMEEENEKLKEKVNTGRRKKEIPTVSVLIFSSHILLDFECRCVLETLCETNS